MGWIQMGEIIQRAVAGTLESSDVFVTLEPNASGLEIEIDSVVQNQFGDAIRKVAEEVLSEQKVQNAKLSIVDRGALDCVIRARVETAVLRGKGEC
jgi:citrate lyase subunit gamma (acyl carrier protein)